MGLRAMKFDLFVLKALEKKGYVLEDIIKLEDKELEELPLSDKIINAVKDYKTRGGLTAAEVANELARIMELDEETNISDKLKEELQVTVQEPVVPVVEVELDETDTSEIVVPVVTDSEESIVRTIASSEDIKIIKDTLQKKELRSFATYTKLLKSEVPAAVLDAVESTTLNSLIDERIAEVKANSTK